MSDSTLYICSSVRTPIGSLNGSLSAVPAVELGAVAIKSALERSGIEHSIVDECILGCVLTGALGQGPARQAWLSSGGGDNVPCTTVGKVCGSGLQSVIFAGRGLMLGEFDVAVAGGMENMSAASYALPVEGGGDVSDERLVKMMVKDGLWDVYNDMHMGEICDALARTEGIGRSQQDDFAILSYKRALASQSAGNWANEIVAISTRDHGIVDTDEGISVFNEDKLRTIRPAFDREKGTITAANASSINDGASALVVANGRGVREHNLTPKARIVGWGSGALSPDRFPAAPVIAVNSALIAAGLTVSDVDYWEINEAFAVVTLLAVRDLGLELERVNAFGGAVALGHPIGASGARILTTLLNVLEHNKAKLGVATLCIGGGEGTALIVERL